MAKTKASKIKKGQTWIPKRGKHELDVLSVLNGSAGEVIIVRKVDRRTEPHRVTAEQITMKAATILCDYTPKEPAQPSLPLKVKP